MNAHALQQRAAGIARDPAFVAGFRSMLATMLGIGAWGLVTGVAMVKAGMSVPLAIFMSLIVYAGSAQLAVLPLLMVGAPLWVVWFTATCVNLRFVILSSMWRHYFGHLRLLHRLTLGYFSGDVIFVTFTHRYPTPEKKPEQLPFFWGAAVANWVFWQVFSIAGILLANVIPLSWGLGFAGVLALMGVLYSMLKDKAAWLACVVACGAAVATFALPLKLNILVAIAAAVTAGLLMETAERRAARHLPQPAIRPPDPAKGEKFPVLPLPEDAPRKEQP
ncbi:AzlC family ABC transporter permease [Comamonas kerstersii]|uniref:Branched-chain amino acid ABC transporter permease n=2 Tax=Comamonas kerstersii TaxID=225992 RepID=A0A1V0BDB8_9BURK|nr:AzlC family ABC transporter permease [Comamonas kerstersii]AQZ97861.1 branched-chain amino acid ABC transporter permease [Comamonas kerstersii]MDO4968249.1 AzlC family ABC transporter permease [Comamonadaceae bacterium]QTW19271.1 AzlC family ABC transporter permease [Comamonas kerstersii]HBW62253.1 branched-chain amino acid ABC transporter permease [Comamonas kerstersii]